MPPNYVSVTNLLLLLIVIELVIALIWGFNLQA
jgi:hypothetical protein